MAMFCKNCIERCMGLIKGDEYYSSWVIPDGDGMICEGCGYEYLKGDDKK